MLLPPGQKLEIARINQWNFLNMTHVEGLSWILGFFKHSEKTHISLQTVSLLGCTQLLEVTIPHEVQLVCPGFLNFRDNHHVDLQLSLSRHVPYGEPEISPVSVTWMPTFQLRSPVTVARMRCTGPQHPWPPQHS